MCTISFLHINIYCCGAREFVIPAHFPLGPRPASRRGVAEDMHQKSKWLRDIAEDDPVLGIPKS